MLLSIGAGVIDRAGCAAKLDFVSGLPHPGLASAKMAIVEPRIAQVSQYGNKIEVRRLKELFDESLEDSSVYINHYRRRLGQ